MCKSPAELAIERFGGVRPLARKLTAAGNPVHYSRVSRWPLPRDKGGSDGRIPQKYHQTILQMARSQKVRFSMKEIIYGANCGGQNA